jgi:superfamily II DNA or RNA helicase
MILQAGVWDDQLALWTPGLDATQCPYSSIIRRNGRKSTPLLKPELKRQWGTVIADESHYLKNRNAMWTRAFTKLKADRLYMLSGTPIPNWAHEAFTQLQLLWPEEAKPGGRLGSYWRWVEEWFDIEDLYVAGRAVSQYNITGLKSARTWAEFRGVNWGSRSLLRKREDVLKDLPELTEQVYRVRLTGEQARVYRELKKDFVSWLDSGAEIAAWNHADQFMKLAKIATQLDGKGAKMSALSDILQDRDKPTLVVAHFRASVEAAAQTAWHSAGKVSVIIDGSTPVPDRAKRVRDFQAGKIDVLCATLDTISEGLTLTAADQIIFLERSFRPSRNEQAMRRIHRIGQTRPVTAIHLVAEKTLDERVLHLLKEKSDQQFEALPRSTIKELI